jgi:mannosyltransferase OCH1-like enzyme
MSLGIKMGGSVTSGMDAATIHKHMVAKYGKMPRVEDAVIPLKLHLFWHDKILPPKMQQNVELLRETNKEFEVIVYDNEMAREYIKAHFSSGRGDVLRAYDTLIPMSFKSDLFRYCVVYKEGGIYLDIKFEPINGFKLMHFVKYRQVWASETANIANTGILVSVPGNPILRRAIELIKYNVANRIMGRQPSSATGPWLLTDAFVSISGKNAMRIFGDSMFKLKMVLKDNVDSSDPIMDGDNKIYLARNGSGGDDIDKSILIPIFKFYRGYRMELKNMSPQMHWIKMWEKGAEYVFGVVS